MIERNVRKRLAPEVVRRLLERDVDLLEPGHEHEDRVGEADDDVPDHDSCYRLPVADRMRESRPPGSSSSSAIPNTT